MLKQEIVDLKLQLNTNSRNTSKPPSSDGYKKKLGIPREKKGKQGGQKGHKGKTLPQTDNPDIIVECIPRACKCGYHFTKEEFTLLEKRQVFELPLPKLELTEYHIFQAVCFCGVKSKGNTPESVKATAQYGNRAKAFAVLLNTHYKIPYKKIQLLFGDLFGYSINESTVYSASQYCFNQGVPFTNKLAERDIRPVKLKMKISNCFRTFKGAEMYTQIESFLSTARKQNRNVFEELCNTFDAYNFLIPNQGTK